MTDWFRSWHGAPTDPKWVLIGRRAGIAPALASAVAWALFDHASQATPRGSVADFDVEVYAAWGGIDESAVAKAIAAMCDRGMISGGMLAKWSKRQPEREDGSAERAKAWRDSKRTQANASERAPESTNAIDQQIQIQIQNRIDTDTDNTPPPPVTSPAKAREGEDLMQSLKLILAVYPKSKTYSPERVIAAMRDTPQADWPAIISGCAGYASDFKAKPTTHPIALDRFIRERLFDNFAGKPSHGAELIQVSHDTPNGRAWDAYERAVKGKPPPWSNGRWYFPTQAPPSLSAPPQNGSLQ